VVSAKANAEIRPEPEFAEGIWKQLRREGWKSNVIGAIVAFNVIGFLIPLFLDEGERGHLALINAPVIVAFFLVAEPIVARRSRRIVDSAFAWVAEGRAPTVDEHATALRLPLIGARTAAVSWLLSVPIFVALNAPTSIGFSYVIAETLMLGGLTTAAVLYLLNERALRPATARTLAARLPTKPMTPGVRGRLLTAWTLATGVPLLGIVVVGIVGVTKSDVGVGYVAAAGLFLAVIALGVGLLATILTAKAIADPVTSVRDGLEQIAEGDLEIHVPVTDASEVGLLQAGFNRMAEGLRERDRIRDLFGRQVGRDVATAALQNGTTLGGEEREIAALFIDLVGSTELAASRPPRDVVRLLNKFFRVVIAEVEAAGGSINKFEGDAALCVFGAPVGCEDPAGDALCAARRLGDRLRAEVGELDFGIGVSAGRAVAGNVGAETRFEYTVIGDPVNEAARLCELAKEKPGRVIASDAALRRADMDESRAWAIGESTLLRGREQLTGLASPR
jgi:adenylate cyclase